MIFGKTDKNYSQFELTEKEAVKIKLDDKIEIMTGKVNTAGLYVKFTDDSSVYLLRNGFIVPSDAEDWYDKTIIEFERQNVKKISLEKNKTSFVLVKNEKEKWLNEKENKEIEKNLIDSLLFEISKMTAISLIEDNELSNYSPQALLKITVISSQKQETLSFFKGKNDYAVKRQSDNQSFTVNEYSISSLLSADDKLK